MADDSMTKDEILAAIRRAAAELGRAPSRGELRRITGVSHYRVLAEFPTLREAVRAAGLEPNPKGEKISTEDLLADWKRVAEKLGRRPSRAEYVREGRYSAGALTVRFGSWGNISTTEGTENRREKKAIHRGGAETRRKEELPKLPELPRLPKAEERNHKGPPFDSQGSLRAGCGTQRKNKGEGGRAEEHGGLMPHKFDRVPLASVPSPVVGMRRVTEEVAQMVVNTLLGSGYWLSAIGSWPEGAQRSAFNVQPRTNPFTTEITEEHGGEPIKRANVIADAQAGTPTGREQNQMQNPFTTEVTEERGGKRNERAEEIVKAQAGSRSGREDFFPLRSSVSSVVKKDRPVMGEPFDRSPMTNAPVNELGVMVLFGMVAARLGLQVESVQGRFPDCLAKRQVAPGKWQHLRIEFEYESKNFKLHGHDPKGCDMIVCWRHNWKECPDNIEVIELCRLFGSN